MPRFDLTDPDLAHLLRWVQDGVVSRRQLLELGARACDIDRMVRRKELTRVVPGVYVEHTGRLTREQREWVAVLAAWPAVLTRESVLPDPPRAAVHVAVALGRRLDLPGWAFAHRTADLETRVDWRLSPPRMELEHALIDVMASAIVDDDIAGAYAQLTRTAFTRRTSPDQILAVLSERRRLAGREVIGGMLRDLRDGACSVLERGYLHRVERDHGLPRGQRQGSSRATGRRTDHDVRYPEFGVIVEMDGRAFHDNTASYDADARRDLAELAVSDEVTARVTYGLVYRETCQTADWIARILQRNGWTGELRPCPRCPDPTSVFSQRT